METEHLLVIAESAAQAAGAKLRDAATQANSHLKAIHAEAGKDVKLAADLASERYLREFLGAESGLPVIGEEEGGDVALFQPDSEQPYWIVDPLDGTSNYQRNLPFCAVSIGLWQGRRPLLGVVYDFFRDECFSGMVEAKRLTLNDRPLTPLWAEEASKATLQTGFPVGRDYDPAALEAFIAQVQRFRKIRSLGSAALGLAYVAAGRIDAYLEEGIMLWDVAAGLALIAAAGGCIQFYPTENKPLQLNVKAAGREAFIA